MSAESKRVRIVAIPVPEATYLVAQREANAAGVPVGTRIRLDMVEFYGKVEARRARAATRRRGA